MAAASSLSDEEEIDENLVLVDFYKEHDCWLRTVQLEEVPPRLKYEIAILFFIATNEVDWMEYLNELGLNYITIHGISYKSRFGNPPLFEAFTLMYQKSFGQVMAVFSEKEKFHILRHVKPYVEGLLLKGRNLVQPSAPPHVPLTGNITEEISEYNKVMDASLQQAQFSRKNIPELQNLRVGIPIKDTSILVFILHAMSDEKIAIELATALQKRGVRVLLSADIFPILRINHAQLLKALNEKMDFIVPLISDELWKQVNSRKTKVESEEDLEAIANRFVYDLALQEYFNSLKNFRVRPVFNPLQSKPPIEKDPILSRPFNLQNEISQLVENMEVTKKYF